LNRKERLITALAVLGSVASIFGFLAQIGIAPLLDPLKMPINVPLWLILGVAGALPLAISWAVRHSTSVLVDRLTTSTTELQSLRENSQQLESIIKAESDRERRLSDAESRLATYESLEAEIMGLLSNGGEYDLAAIVERTSIRIHMNGYQMVLRAINALGDKIEGTGGVGIARYRRRRTPNSAAPADQKASLSGR
jgi:hypothetical protein